ncbi:MAG TPA: hypothetical protein DCS82_10265 [Rhodospirillaceae bacterium]|nr:hypothetical protein [Rhodospirillaceae bacterium]HAA91814.1 hypothetical protein [Rhodospirillaceae bacterium]HAT36091.1 hypothetical protein [Rhodospirillaceae bacterium]
MEWRFIAMARFSRRLNMWREAGLIDADHVAAIEKFERERGAAGWVVRGLLGLAAVAIGIGSIALIAANWETIPDTVKIGVDFLLLIALACGVWLMDARGRETGAEILIVAFLIGCLATIGLVSQIFHLAGQLEHALLFWGAITAPLVLLARHRLVAALWSWTVLGAAFASLIRELERSAGWKSDEAFLALYAILPLFAAFIAVLVRKLGRVENLAWALQAAAVITWYASIGLLDASLTWSSGRAESSAAVIIPVAIPAAVALAVGGYVLACIWDGLGRARAILVGVQLILYLALLFVALVTDGKSYFGILFFVALFGLAAADAGRTGRRTLFQWLLAIIGARMLLFYFDAFGGLATTGVGLIGAGVFILLMTLVWHRNRNRVLTWLEGAGQ